MDTQTRIDRFLKKLENSKRNTAKSTLYAEGVKAKLKQARFSLENLKRLENLENKTSTQENTTTQNGQTILSINEQVNYYCDAFWDFLRSSLDILGQLINEIRKFNIGVNYHHL